MPYDDPGSSSNANGKDGGEPTKAGEAPPAMIPPSKYPIYGPFIPTRDVVVGDKAGNRYEYVPTGPQGFYENGYGSNYFSACT